MNKVCLFESDQLYANTFQVVQLFFTEFFQEDLCIRLHNAVIAADPAIVLAIHIVEKQIVIAVIDKIGFIAASCITLAGSIGR